MTASVMPPSNRAAASAAAGRAAISISPPGSPTSSTRCSANSWAAGAAAAAARRAAPICATTWKSSLEEAFAGKQTQIKIPSSVVCEDCKGTGGVGGAAPVDCTTCRGAGKVRATQGFFTIERTCPTCHGMGKVIKDPCRGCGGTGRVRRRRRWRSPCRPGVEDGTRIRLAGEGEPGMRGAPNGDLYIFLSVRPHRLFQREGANIHCRVPISMVTAALGGTIEVPSIDGSRAKIAIPAGTQSGHQFRLRGKGMSVLRSPARGDMFVEAVVETPVNLSKRQEELLREFEKVDGGKETSPAIGRLLRQGEGTLGRPEGLTP